METTWQLYIDGHWVGAQRGKTFDVAESRELDSIYEDLGSQLATRPEKREITAGFAAGGLVLLVAAAALSLRTAGRLP